MTKIREYAEKLFNTVSEGLRLALTDPFGAAVSAVCWIIPAAIGVWMVKSVGIWALKLTGVY
tara:strand:+ start:267 stop:452 length:186 start_codon:yes stop_codon:yes gene_type:complete